MYPGVHKYATGTATLPHRLANQVERVDSAGIEIVRNMSGDRALEWTFTEVFSVGGGGSEGFEFYRLSADADGRGNVYVLDREITESWCSAGKGNI